MKMTIRAHFDGRVIVPDEPLTLPADQPLVAELTIPSTTEPAATLAERQAAFERFMSRVNEGPSIPDEALRRENMYED